MSIAGNSPEKITLHATGGVEPSSHDITGQRPVTVGRAADCDICLLDDAVSRRHATVVRRAGTWFVVHQGARGITAVNGVQIMPSDPTALADGDMLKIGPRVFRVSFGGPKSVAVQTEDDAARPMQRVERASTSMRMSGADRRLRLLTDCIERLSEATDEETLAATALEAALAGSGYARAAILRAVGGRGGRDVEIVASARARADDREQFRFSRSLIESASDSGEAAVLTGGGADRVASHSIAELGIHSALCAPVFLGRAISAYMYLDARGRESQVHADAAGFCEAVAKAYGLTLAEAKRLELERRQADLAAELLAAREVQQLIVPAGDDDLGFLAYAVEVRPGLFVAGDLFDVVRLVDGRVAVCIGDATGHGAASAMLMAMTQSSLHAELRRDGDPAAAVRAVNEYMSQRTAHGAGAGRFVSLWVGVFAPDGSVRFVDAGHGHWMVSASGAPARRVQTATGIPVGIDGGHEYETSTLQLGRGDRVVVYSDGLVEQRNARGEQFGPDRFLESLGSAGSAREGVDAMFSAVSAFAGTTSLDDDATLGIVEFRG